MGISTFLHVLSAEEIEFLSGLSDENLIKVIGKLCDRPFIDNPAAHDDDDDEDTEELGALKKEDIKVNVMEVIRNLLEGKSEDENLSGELDQNTPVLRRADLDKCGALVSYLATQLSGIDTKDGEYELLSSCLPLTSVGSNVCYGPVMVARPEDIAALLEALDNKLTSKEAILSFFDDVSKIPLEAHGGLYELSKNDIDYVWIHLTNLLIMLRHAREHGLGFLIHFW